MTIYEIIGINLNKKEMLSFVGGGGKTTTIFRLAEELAKLNKKVLISTTTKIFTPSKDEYNYFFLKDIDEGFSAINGTITVLGEEIREDKLIGISKDKSDKIFKRDIFDYILMESDGSKRKPIKAPGSDEPVIPNTTTKTIGVIGLDCLGEKIDDLTVHRPELLLEISEKSSLDIIDEETIVKLILHKNGIFKNARGDKILLLNKADNEVKIAKGIKIREKLDNTIYSKIIIGDIIKRKFY